MRNHKFKKKDIKKIAAKKVVILVAVVIMAQKHMKRLVFFSYIHKIQIRCVSYITYIHTTTHIYIHTLGLQEGNLKNYIMSHSAHF